MTVQEAVISLLRRLGETDPDDQMIYDVDCGLHSGFPPCCIAFYVKVWSRWTRMIDALQAHGETREQLLERATPAQEEALRAMWSYQRMIRESGVGYVPCPRCLLEDNFVVSGPCRPHLSKRQRDLVRKALVS